MPVYGNDNVRRALSDRPELLNNPHALEKLVRLYFPHWKEASTMLAPSDNAQMGETRRCLASPRKQGMSASSMMVIIVNPPCSQYLRPRMINSHWIPQKTHFKPWTANYSRPSRQGPDIFLRSEIT